MYVFLLANTEFKLGKELDLRACIRQECSSGMTRMTEGLKVCHSRRSGLPLAVGRWPARNSLAAGGTSCAESWQVSVQGSCNTERGRKILEPSVDTCGT